MRGWKLFLSTLLLAVSGWAAEPYRMGEGWQPTDEPVYIGGYMSLLTDLRERQQTVAVDEFALMVYGEFERWGFMSELESVAPYARSFGDDAGETVHAHLHLERLYATYYIDDDSEITVGKFFSEVGFWNVAPINVLRDTTSDPHYIDTMFPNTTTGLLYRRFLPNATLYLTLQHNRGIDETFNNYNTRRHYAAALSFDGGAGEWKTGAGWFEDSEGERSLYATLAYRANFEAWSIMAESALRRPRGKEEWYYDVYGQAVWHMRSRHDLIARFEAYEDDSSVSMDRSAVFGYTYRPYVYMALKGELTLRERKPDRLLFSFSIMF
ncbi:hypothetical protein [Hydrogenimonas sp.]